MAWWQTALKVVAKTPKLLADVATQVANNNVRDANKALKRSDLSDEQRANYEDSRSKSEAFLNRNQDSDGEK